MHEQEWLAERFEANRSRLRAVAYRMLGSLSEADDAVQEAWLRLSRTDTSGVQNFEGWLTTVVARVSLDMLRSRKAHSEEPLDGGEPEKPIATSPSGGTDPEREALLAESVGLALLVVLDTLDPAERLAFVLHDMFAVPFDEIAGIVGRSPDATRQLASRARRRVQGADAAPYADRTRHREIVEAFVAALRGGDFDSLVALLDPDLVVRAEVAGTPDAPRVVRGAQTWAKGAIAYSQSHLLAFSRAVAQPVLVNGAVGLVVAQRGRLFRALIFKITGGKIAQIDVITDPARLRQLDLAVLND